MEQIDTVINTITLIGGAGVMITTQVLKSKLIPVAFQKHPVPTALGVAALGTYLSLLWSDFVFAWANWEQATATFLVVLGVAVFIYNNVVNNWASVKNTEGPKD